MNRHAELVDRMADTLGVDLAEEALRGRMPPQELRTSVLRCTGCGDPDGCERWLAKHETGADATPDFCRNKALIERLADLR